MRRRVDRLPKIFYETYYPDIDVMRSIVLPEYLGVVAFGVKAGVILPGDDIVETVSELIEACDGDGLIGDGDIVCVTESVVARSQGNYVTEEEIAYEIRALLGLSAADHLGVLYPIVSRNRYSAVLKGMAKAVPQGKVTVQLSYPVDEVGNQTVSEEYLSERCLGLDDRLTHEDLDGVSFLHPLTGVDYIDLYREIIQGEGAEPYILLCNDPLELVRHDPDGIVVSDIHTRFRTKALLEEEFTNSITLQDIFSRSGPGSWSEWGLLGSNLSSGGRIKLAPREGDLVASKIRDSIEKRTGKSVEVVIYGDGAYKDPSSGIFELADPSTFFGLTDGLKDVRRTGVKYKWLTDTLHGEGKTREYIEQRIEALKKETLELDSPLMEGTTPRRLADVVSSLADLVSGSADAGTPIVVVKGLMRKV